MTDCKSLCEIFQRTVAHHPDAPALRAHGTEVDITWAEYARRVERIAAGLAGLGVGRGDTVGLMMSNRPEAYLCDMAAIHLGATPFSIYNTSAPEQIEQILGNAGNAVMVCEAAFADRLRAARPGLRHLVTVDGGEGTVPLEELETASPGGFDFEARWRSVGPQDGLTILYTSGTTGPSKGVELTHANMLASMAALVDVIPAVVTDRVLSYLPMAHLADRLFSHYLPFSAGACLITLADAKQLGAALRDVRPTLWLAVPRVWEKMKAAIEAGFGADPDPAAVRGGLGLDQVRRSFTGAAPSSIEVLDFFAALGLPICEVWGMSEIGVVTGTLPGEEVAGSVGKVLAGYELRLADDGELLCRGAAVMKGYRHDPERTAEAVDPNGWMHTGDIGTIDGQGYVRIVDRKKELIINSGGKNMSPANIEAKLKAADLMIGQAVAIGDRRPYNVALIVLDPDASAAYAAAHGLPSAAPADLCADPGVVAVVDAAVARANEQLSRIEQIKRYAILPVDWEPAGDELTPTSKLKRRPIAEKYAAVIDDLYARTDL